MKIFSLVLLLSISSIAVFAQSNRAMGVNLYNEGQYQKSIEALTKEADKETDLWLYIGMANLKLKRNDEAIAAFLKADAFAGPEITDVDTRSKNLVRKRPGYTDQAREKNVQGSVKIALEINAEGRVTTAFPFKTLPHGLTENAVKSAKASTFTPAIKNGKAVPTIRIMSYGFTVY